MRDFLLSQMTADAQSFMRVVEENPDPESWTSVQFNPCIMADVFVHTTPQIYLDILVEGLQSLALFYSGDGSKRALGTIYFNLSKLPLRETWISQMRSLLGGPTSLTRTTINHSVSNSELVPWHNIARTDRSLGRINSTIDLLRHLIDRKPHTSQNYGAMYDLIKILRKLHRHEEAAEVLSKLPSPVDGPTEKEIAETLGDFYIWARKAFTSHLPHTKHGEAGRILQMTYTTASSVFGKNSLSAIHCAVLLENFYSQQCCYSKDALEKFRQAGTTLLCRQYCGRTNLKNGLGLQMGKVLLAQGMLEEAVICFEEFCTAANEELGPEDPMSKRTKRLLIKSKRERSIEIRDDKAGRIGTFWGSMIFPRDLNALEMSEEGKRRGTSWRQMNSSERWK
jgi:hypothetical protein